MSDIATAIGIATSEWQRELKAAEELFKTYKHFHKSEWQWDWLVYSGKQGISNNAALHVWTKRKKNKERTGTPLQQRTERRNKRKYTPYSKSVDWNKFEY